MATYTVTIPDHLAAPLALAVATHNANTGADHTVAEFLTELALELATGNAVAAETERLRIEADAKLNADRLAYRQKIIDKPLLNAEAEPAP
jgi:hypothetical protein